jgi:hypothetical protein
MTMGDLIPDGAMVRTYRPRLGQLLETVGSHVLSAPYVPAEVDLRVVEPVVHDPDDAMAERPDGILLAVGVRTASSAASVLVREARRNCYSAIVFKDRGTDLTGLIATAREVGLALLLAPCDMAWRQLDALITAALSVPGTAAATYASVGMGDLFALANAIAAALGGASCIEDPQGNVLAYSNLPDQEIDEIRKQGILGRKTPARPTNRMEYSRVFRARGTVRFASLHAEHSPRLAIAVRAGSELLGYIWILDGAPPVVSGAEQLLEDAGRLAALHLLHARSPGNPLRRRRAETLRALLEGDVSESSAAVRLGPLAERATALIAFSPGDAGGEPELAAARILDLITISCEGWHKHAVCTTSRGRVYAVLPVAPNTTQVRLVRFAEETARAVRKSTQMSLHVGISPEIPRLDGVPAARRLADHVVEVLAEAGPAGVATEEQVRSHITLLQLAEHGGVATEHLLTPVRRMIEYDAAHETTHATTLLAYLEAFGEAAKAAATLSVHENTLRYRIRRLQELFEVDLSDPADRLVIWLQLRLLQRR